MPYVLEGIKASSPVRITAQTPRRKGVPVPTFRTPTGLTPWWRPIAIGWPNTGSSATYIGPRPSCPGCHVGVSSPELIPANLRRFSGSKACFVTVPPIPSMSVAFGPTEDVQRYKKITAKGVAPPANYNISMTAAGPLRLPDNLWLPDNPALMV